MTDARILHIQKVAGIAGSENHLLTLLPALAAHGLQPEMLVLADGCDRPGPFIDRMRAAGILARVMPILGDADPTLLPRLTAMIRQNGYALVHTHLLHADLHGRPAARLAGARVISTYHNVDPYHLLIGVRQMDMVTARLCSRVICISEAVRQFVHGKLGVSFGRLEVIHYGLKLSERSGRTFGLRHSLGIGQGEPLVGIVARLIEQKGHTYLLEAMHSVAGWIPSVHLAIVGEGNLRPELERMSARLGLGGRVHFLGYRSDAPELMCEFDVFVLTSLFEGLGLVLLEAMAASKPIVATGVSAIPEIVVEGETGLLVPPRDTTSLARAIHGLISDPARARDMGRRGRERLERHFTVENMVAATMAVYRSVLAT